MKNLGGFGIKRNVANGTYILPEIFSGLENSPSLKKMFCDNGIFFEKLKSVKINMNKKPWIIWVNPKNGNIMIYEKYLKKADRKILYLDLFHELVHIKQFRKGLELFDEKFSYVDRPTEIEAYKLTVEEAKRIGMSKRQIINYLKVDWISDGDNKKLVENVMKW